MEFGWRMLMGLKATDEPPSIDGPHVPAVGPRPYAVGDAIAGAQEKGTLPFV
jgi:hypothetical protein